MSKWEFYECSIEDQRAFVAVDVELRPRAPIATLPYSVRVCARLLAPRDDGLNSSEDLEALGSLEELLETELAALGALYVGRATSGGTRRHYYYAPNLAGLEPALDRIRGSAPERALEVGWFEDPEWAQYVEFLYPNELGWQWIKDARVLDVLAREGDSGLAERRIDHWAYFPAAIDRELCAARAADEGFQIDGGADDAKGERPFALYLSRHGAPRQVFHWTHLLTRLAREHGGVYDGWECPVEKPVDTPDGEGRATPAPG